MFLLGELVILISYLANGFVGFIATIIFFGIITINEGKNKEEKILNLLILSLPLHSISILGEKLNHAFSWPIILLSILLINNIYTILKNKIAIKKGYIIGFLLFCIVLALSNYRFDFINSTREIGQLMIMCLPILTTFICKEQYTLKLNEGYFKRGLLKIESVIVATAIATIYQFAMYKFGNLNLGEITIFSNRTIYDLIFKGYSVLSLFLSLGVIIVINDIIELIIERKIKSKNFIEEVLKLIIIVAAIFINTSRTGILAAIFTTFILMCNFLKVMTKKQRKVTIVLFIIASALLIMFFSLSRKDMTFFNDNGRLLTYKNALTFTFESPINFILGCGLYEGNYSHMSPHNFILELMTTSGIIITTTLLYLIYKLITFIKDSKYRYLCYNILIGSMFITSFQGNPFTTIIGIFAILDQTSMLKKEKEND